ncbi:hypothetical protein CKO15_06235 [Halorhodospira abdelmalekii]|uniref:hypothetical protein n=1 Tax=Halorhodospira abdelmalekii TaxID=421629 RepID=UPI0019053039|nr:hypothetical protein [Halorhodospira abdelmalekii]MBK1734895.1 hypothetical protein [Halorhodospira abdelmalekii]
MELIIFSAALIFILWLLVQLGVGIYHHGLRRGFRCWVRGLPHLVSAVLASTLKLIPMLVIHIIESPRGRRSFAEEIPDASEGQKSGVPDVHEDADWINLGIPPEPPECKRHW